MEISEYVRNKIEEDNNTYNKDTAPERERLRCAIESLKGRAMLINNLELNTNEIVNAKSQLQNKYYICK